ncbi:uncharacterized protein A1O9_09332 [Exophiala aquamarina CBS 119918]|uniref:Uncharacterized protein n=1 Tax=Exophiala aquamarina CBS 119918 TaxID=1182545 RepID=A0A072P473_9EURO|nr:uncharacterized protein A1O9_09332 [Exophiala aquamarina CBS 119918]KEF54889.1 hypothetical protein A1O9_09332 [Exophiala aquamarina CBS 119918]
MPSRGRSSRPKRVWAVELALSPAGPRPEHCQADETPIFKPEWFSGVTKIEAGSDEDKEAPNGQDFEETLEQALQRPGHYRVYIPVGHRHPYPSLLVKGSICRNIMLLHSQSLTPTQISKKRGTSEVLGQYSVAEVKEIIDICELLGLDGKAPLGSELEDWENSSIEGWWEESYCEGLRRREPIGREIAGYDWIGLNGQRQRLVLKADAWICASALWYFKRKGETTAAAAAAAAKGGQTRDLQSALDKFSSSNVGTGALLGAVISHPPLTSDRWFHPEVAVPRERFLTSHNIRL